MNLTPLESNSYAISGHISHGITLLRRIVGGEGFAYFRDQASNRRLKLNALSLPKLHEVSIFANSPFIGFPVGVTGIDSNITNCVGLLYGDKFLLA